jgi:hypothetical protein
MKQDGAQLLEKAATHFSQNKVNLEAWMQTFDASHSEQMTFKDLRTIFTRLDMPLS